MLDDTPVPAWLSDAVSFDAPFVPPPQRRDLKWIAVDFDGTLAVGMWTPDNPTTTIGDPIWPNIYKLRRAHAAGYSAAIHTSRSWTDYEVIEAWLNHYMVPFRRIICGKLLGVSYVDDRGVHESAVSWIPGESHCATCTCHEEAA